MDTPLLNITQQHRYTGHNSGIYALERKENTDIIWSGSGDEVVAQWDMSSASDGVMITRSSGIIYSLRHINHNNHLLIGQSNGGVHVINLDNHAELRLLQYHQSPVFYIGYAELHKLVFTLAGDGFLNVIAAADYHLVKSIKLAEGKLRCIVFNPHKNECAVTCSDGSIAILSLPEVKIIHRFQAHQQDFSVYALAYSPDARCLLSGARDAHLNIFSTDDYQLIQSIPAHNFSVYDIAYHHSQKIFATASRDKTIKIWDANTFEVLARIDQENYNGHKHSVNRIKWIGDLLISAGDDRSIISWKILIT